MTLVLDDQGKPLYRDGKPVYTSDGQNYDGTVHHMYAPDGKLKGEMPSGSTINAIA
ncbi:hypothetical protein KUH03_28275 [Sphingobacterium sp. E70]|uniref:hypothetical protein n=1 Tax=Sphingobacterium sp. E70 TaxID=2853439 RepID=UPI00211C7E72|nr:hypothetical protein [Sphingobacterium sp. E70]ULT23104.1 hypothetical protein KUH03_28275 [Sphingobacterium sp. E70]